MSYPVLCKMFLRFALLIKCDNTFVHQIPLLFVFQLVEHVVTTAVLTMHKRVADDEGTATTKLMNEVWYVETCMNVKAIYSYSDIL